MGYNPNIPHLQVGYNPFTNHLLTSWDIQVGHDFSWSKQLKMLSFAETFLNFGRRRAKGPSSRYYQAQLGGCQSKKGRTPKIWGPKKGKMKIKVSFASYTISIHIFLLNDLEWEFGRVYI